MVQHDLNMVVKHLNWHMLCVCYYSLATITTPNSMPCPERVRRAAKSEGEKDMSST